MRGIVLIALFAGLLVLSSIDSQTNDDDWPQFAHDAQHTNYSPTNGPERPELLWKQSTELNIDSQPIASDNVILLIPGWTECFPCPPFEMKINALDIFTGWNIWKSHTNASYFEDTVAVNGEDVFIVDTQDTLVLKLLDMATGELGWKIPIPGKYISTPSIDNGKIFINTVPLICLNQEDGTILWNNYANTTQSFNSIYYPPMIADNKVFVLDSDKSILYCFDENDGKELWRFEKSSMGTPRFLRNEVLISDSEKLYALNSENGEVIWEWESENKTGEIEAIADDKFIVSSWKEKDSPGIYDLYIYSLDSQTKKVDWTSDFLDITLNHKIVAAKNMIYIVDSIGKIYVLDMESGETVWEYELEGEPDDSFLIVADGILFVTYDMNIYAFSTNPDVYLKQGNTFQNDKDYEKALNSFEKAKEFHEEAGNVEGKANAEGRIRRVKILIAIESLKEKKEEISIGMAFIVAFLFLLYINIKLRKE